MHKLTKHAAHMLKITFELRPDESLTAQQVQEIVDKARAAGMTPEQWIKKLVMERVRELGGGMPAASMKHHSAA
jgi:hypothetical protein